MNDILFSIGIPVVKTEFLKSAIKCCLNQSYKSIELIILNNGKTDEIRERIRQIAINYTDSRIKYYENESQLPIVTNWNKTLSYANGDYFSILCDDDYWEPEYIEEMVALSYQYPDTNIYHSRVLIVDDKDKCVNISPVCPQFESYLDFIYSRIKGYRLQYLSDFTVRTKAIREIGGFIDIPSGWGSDDLTWFTIAKNGGIAYNSKPLYHYRDSMINVTNTTNLETKIKATILFIDGVRDLLENNNRETIFEEVQINFIQTSLINMIDIRLSSYIVALFKSKHLYNKLTNKLLVPVYKRYIIKKYKF